MSPSSPRLRVLVADDHEALRLGLAAIIQSAPELELAGEAVDGDDALRQHEALRPDVTTLDLRMPGRDGLQVVQQILGRDPGARILVMTMFDDEQDIVHSVRAGALGYILKSASREQIVSAILQVGRGGRWLPDVVAAKLASSLTAPALTPREMEVLQHLHEGSSNKEIGRHLGTTEGTVKAQVRDIFDKLGASSRTEAVKIALRRGLIRRKD